MKKVILSVAFMLAAGATFAQTNKSDVYQTGTSQNALVSQQGANNTSNVDQGTQPTIAAGSYSNYTNVAQVGQNNSAMVSQNNQNNQAFQTQNGAMNSASIWQDQSIGTNVNGSDYARQTQSQNHNVAVIDQGTSGNALPVNPFSISQQNIAGMVTVPYLPHGGNSATQNQSGDYGKAYASQGGQSNFSTQTQVGAGAVAGAENVSNHFQYGQGNNATSYQNGYALQNNTLQIGASNAANVTQWGNAHESVTMQNGTSNNAVVNQNN